jgi:hypothetical protein
MLRKLFDVGIVAVIMWLANKLILTSLLVKITNENAIATIIALVIIFITVISPIILRK